MSNAIDDRKRMKAIGAAWRRVGAFGGRGWRRLRRELATPPEMRTQNRLARRQLLPLHDDSILTAFAPGLLDLGRRLQQDDRPIVVGPWLSELGFEVLYWIPFVKWFVERFAIAPQRLVFVSRGGMSAWYDRASWEGAPRYVDLFATIHPDDYRARNAIRWQRSGDQKQRHNDRFEAEILADVASRLGLAEHHRLHPSAMYGFFAVFWTSHRRLGVGADAIMQHSRFERLRALPPWSGPALPASFVAVKFYDRPSLPRTPSTAARIERLLRQVAESRSVISLDTSFSADDHSCFPLPEHPSIVSAREWMTPQTNLQTQTQLLAAADFFVGTYGGTAYMPAFVDTPAIGLYSEPSNLNFAHQLIAMRASRDLGRSVALLGLEDCGRLADIIAGDP